MEVGTGLALLGAAHLAEKVLGPTAEYVGAGIQTWSERRVANVRRIFQHAGKRLGPEGLAGSGSVPPRVLKGILDEGSFIEDELGAEYLGGVLASSRTEVSRDDRGAAQVALVGRLSTYQLRTHYLLYTACQRAIAGKSFEIGQQTARKRHATCFMPVEVYATAMAPSAEEAADFAAIMSHSISGLVREALLEDEYQYGSAEHLRGGRHGGRMFSGPGIVYAPEC